MERSFHRIRLTLAVLVGLCLVLSLSFAQESRAILSGRVVDPQGAAVPNAKVEARNLDTNVAVSATTNESGLYTLPPLNPGRYSITVTASGFKTRVQSEVELRAADRRQIDFGLELGALTETVTVTGEAPLVDAASASLGTTINKQLVSNLPVFGRNSFTLLRYATGVVYSPGRASSGERPFDNGGMDAVTINGGPARANEYLIDGVPNTNNTDTGQGVYLTFAPPPDAVEEFKVQTNLYDAEYGRTGGGVISVSLKSGTNAYHGAAYWYVRNDKLNANDIASNAAGRPLSAFRWNQPGAQLQGPVRLPGIYNGKDRTFFMYNWEAIRSSIPRPSNMVVPTLLERTGDFSRTYVSGTSGAVIQLYDPLTTVETSPGTYTRQVFPGSILPASRINSIAKKIMEWYPKPAIDNVARGATNLTVSPNPTTDAYDIHTIRVDHNLTAAHKFFATFMRSNRHEDGGLGGGRSVFIGMGKREAAPTYYHWRTNHGANFNLTSTLSPTFISALRVGWNRHVLGIYQYAMDYDPANLGFPKSLSAQVQSLSFPTISIGGYQTIGYSGTATMTNYSDTWTVGDTVTKLAGSHSMKFGADLRLLLNNLATKRPSFSVSATNNFTRGNPLVNSATYGDGLASFLLGYPSSASSTYENHPAWGQRYYALFFQDDWRVSRNFTLNLGLRWDYESPNADRYDRAVRGFDPSGTYTIGTVSVRGGLLFADSNNRLPFKRDLNNFQGRIGMAYKATEKLVFRGGWGMSYVPTAGDRPPSTGFSRTTDPSMSAADAGIIPLLVSPGCVGPDCGMLTNPFPTGINLPRGRADGLRTNAGQSISYYWPERSVPYVHNFSAGFQYELPFRTVAEASYVGTRSRQLATSKDINGITYAQYMANGSALTTQVSNPFAGQLPGTGMNGSTITLEQSLRPYPQFTGITEMGRTIGTSRYDSLQVRVEKRLSAGLTALFTGTWSWNTTFNTYLNGSMDAIGQFIQRLGGSPPQVLQLTATYTVPLFQDSPRVVRSLLGGWTAAATFSKQSGGLMSVGGARSTGLDPRIPNPTEARMFNTCTFNSNNNTRQNCLSPDEPIAWIIDKPYTLLTQPQPQFNKWRSVSPPNVNLALFKAFQIVESFRAELRAESFNAMNTPVKVNPNTTATSSLFGRIASISQNNDPRSVQLSLRLSF